MEGDARFVHFAPGSLALDINSVLSIPLAVRDRAVGALNVYSHLANAFDAKTEEMVQSMADYAAEVISTSPLYAYTLDMVEGLVETLEDQAIIAQATGVIMATEQRATEEP